MHQTTTTRVALACIPPLLLLLAAPGLGAEKAYYAIRANDKLIGYAAVESERLQREGREVQRLKSLTVLKFALLGAERRTRLESETLLDALSRAPLEHRLTNTTNDQVRHLRCEVADGQARIWQYDEGQERGEPQVVKLPEGVVIMAGNNFSHWQPIIQAAALRAADGTAKIPVLLPEAAQVQKIQFSEGESQAIDLPGASGTGDLWQMHGDDLQVLVDSKSGQLLRMTLPSQQTVIELADEGIVKLAQKAAAEEVLAQHFVQSNVVFDDFLQVEQLTAEIDVQVIGSGVQNEAGVLSTAMQEFDGRKDGAQVTGTVVIQTRPYSGQQSPGFPAPGKRDENPQDKAQQDRDQKLAEWLEPSPLIECDHEAVVAKSRQLIRGAKTRWEAVRRVGGWVHKEIRYTIADSPSARMALEKREGDCGPHSTLTVALLRAAGVPARLVGGVMYTPTFGGSFGQHAWVEVHMGPQGWVPIDPTTGEFEKLSATHIKLFEGMGGVRPKTIHVAAFQPPNREPTDEPARKAKPLPWKLDTQYTYRYSQGGQELGRDTFKIVKAQHDGQPAYRLQSTLDLKTSGVTVKSETELLVKPDMLPLKFKRDLDAAGNKATIECAFADGQVDVKISGSTNLSREIKLPAGTYCFDNNFMGCFALICSQLSLEADQPVKVATFHPSSLQQISLTLTPQAPQPLAVAGQQLQCYQCQVDPIKNIFWITQDGRFVKASQGNVVIELLAQGKE